MGSQSRGLAPKYTSTITGHETWVHSDEYASPGWMHPSTPT